MLITCTYMYKWIRFMKIHNLFHIRSIAACLRLGFWPLCINYVIDLRTFNLLMDYNLNNYEMKLATNPMQIFNAFLNSYVDTRLINLSSLAKNSSHCWVVCVLGLPIRQRILQRNTTYLYINIICHDHICLSSPQFKVSYDKFYLFRC